MPRVPLPAELTSRAFTTSEALGLEVGAKRLRSVDLCRPLHGVRSATPPAEVAALATAARLVLPSDTAFSHCTAAALHGLSLPRVREHVEPLHVMRATRRNPVDRPTVLPHRGLETRTTVTVRGLPLVGLADTWCDLGELLGHDDLVVLGDQVANRLGSVEPLRESLAARVRPRGAVRLRLALRWIRVGSGSPMETRTRLLFGRAGLPEPELNVEIGHSDGGFLCRADFAWREKRVIGEYQGSAHFADFSRGDDDISRRLLAEDSAWKYIEVTKTDYFNPARRHAMLTRFARYLGVEKVAFRPSAGIDGPIPTPSTVCRGRR
ncbi:MAG TPA: hypothetical protein VH915_15345 [Pedococcus sp.]|jgi:hypothetical protein